MTNRQSHNSNYFGIFSGIPLLVLLGFFVAFLMNKDPNLIIIKQYLPLLRMPIIAGLMLFFFPLFSSTKVINKLLGNLFVMRGVGQLITVLGFSIGTAAMIVCSFNFIAVNASERFNIEPLSTIFNINGINLDILSLISIIILASPTWIFTILLTLCDWEKISPKFCKCKQENPNELNFNKNPNELKLNKSRKNKVKDKKRQSEIKYSVIGTSFILLLTVTLAGVIYNNIEFIYPANLYPLNLNNSYLIEKSIDFNRIGNNLEYAYKFLSLFILGCVVYVLGFLLFNPEKINRGDQPLRNFTQRRSAPALFYLLLMIWVLTGFFSGLSFWIDFSHLPITLIVLALSGCLYFIFYIDNFFELQKSSNTVSYIDCKTIIKNRLEKSKTKTLVVVATSGGGIQASGWTAKVLCGLQQKLGESFTQSIGLISAVSGGSVGTMFFLDQFDKEKNCPTNESLDSIFNNATKDWLDAVGWGIAYPDMMKFFAVPWVFIILLNKAINFILGITKKNKTGSQSTELSVLDSFLKYSDRGYSLESYWKKQLKRPLKNPLKNPSDSLYTTLDDWREEVNKGTIPIPVFNATLLENGRRFLISPIKFQNETDKDMKAKDFQTSYTDYDLDVTTAARLSASFPYVTPSSRPYDSSSKKELDIDKAPVIYHVADGGYFDNFGTFTALEWLDKNIEGLMNDSIVERVIFIQINHFPTEGSGEENGFPGWLTELIGPLLTLFNIKDSTQIARNELEIELIKSKIDLIQHKIENKKNELKDRKTEDAFQSFTITFEGKNAPLSWYLTNYQIKELDCSWNKFLRKESDVAGFKELKELWKHIKPTDK